MTRNEAVVLCDIGRIGPDYLPGHAHADTLSFELSLAGERVIVNSGISEYGLSSERIRRVQLTPLLWWQKQILLKFGVVFVWDNALEWTRLRSLTLESFIVGARHDGYLGFLKGRTTAVDGV